MELSLHHVISLDWALPRISKHLKTLFVSREDHHVYRWWSCDMDPIFLCAGVNVHGSNVEGRREQGGMMSRREAVAASRRRPRPAA